MVDRRRVTTNCGLAAPVVALGAIALATLVAPPETFTWRTRALSDMGRPGTETFWLFNGGLVLGGVLGIPFVWHVWTETRNRLQRAGTMALAGSLVGMVGVGVFYVEHTTYYLSASMHAPAALFTFATAPIAALLFGIGARAVGQSRLAIGSIASAAVSILGWTVWIGYLETLATTPGAWFAVPEFVAACSLGGWVLLLAIGYRNRDTAANRP